MWFRHLDYARDAPLTDLGPAAIDGLFSRNICVGFGSWGAPEAVPALTAA